jgi:hypothetical protein
MNIGEEAKPYHVDSPETTKLFDLEMTITAQTGGQHTDDSGISCDWVAFHRGE